MNTRRVEHAPVRVKSRRYDATRRRELAALSRERVLDAAEAAFLGRGYAATTVAELAEAAGVSVELIYKSYGGKAGLVRAIYYRGLRGAGPVDARQRSDTLSASDIPADALLREWATLSTEVSPRVTPIELLVRTAAAHDPSLTELLAEMSQQRLERMERNAQRLRRHAGVRRDLTVAVTRDVLWTYSSPDLYALLVLDRGWPLPRFGDFLYRGMRAQLLEPR